MEEELTDDPLCDKELSPRLWGIILSTITEKSKYEQLMRSAFKLASKGLGYTSPNPAVGAIIIRDGKIISKGYHRRPGEAHAEINSLKNFDGDARGAEIITTLEPCAHHGKTPPCVDAIIESGIKKVISAIRDKNPLVQGRGFKSLREAGIEVMEGILAGDAEVPGPAQWNMQDPCPQRSQR